jgi:hypothetical protein
MGDRVITWTNRNTNPLGSQTGEVVQKGRDKTGEQDCVYEPFRGLICIHRIPKETARIESIFRKDLRSRIQPAHSEIM